MNGLVRDGDDADLLDQNVPEARSTPSHVVWPSASSNLLTPQRTFVQDMAQRNAMFRPNW